jgi:hypothetical protein
MIARRPDSMATHAVACRLERKFNRFSTAQMDRIMSLAQMRFKHLCTLGRAPPPDPLIQPYMVRARVRWQPGRPVITVRRRRLSGCQSARSSGRCSAPALTPCMRRRRCRRRRRR